MMSMPENSREIFDPTNVQIADIEEYGYPYLV